MGFSLKKLLEGAAAQVNPFDRGKTFSTVNQQTPQPGSTARTSSLSVGNAQPQQNLSVASTATPRQVRVTPTIQYAQPKITVAAPQQLSVGNTVIPNTTTIRPTEFKPQSNPIDRVLSPIGAGVLRSGAGTAESLSGLYDLVTPGVGQNRFGKNAQQAGASLDTVVRQNDYSSPLYKGAQAATDIGTFLLPGTQVKSTKLAAPIIKALKPVAEYNKVGNLAARTTGYLARPDVATNIATGTALTQGLRSNRGQDINPTNFATDLAINTSGALGLKVVGKVIKSSAKATTKLIRNQDGYLAGSEPTPKQPKVDLQVGKTPVQIAEDSHQAKLKANNLTQNEYAGLHQNVTDLERVQQQAHQTVNNAVASAPRDATGKFTPEAQIQLKKLTDAWGKTQEAHVAALNKVRVIDGQEPIVLGNRTPAPQVGKTASPAINSPVQPPIVGPNLNNKILASKPTEQLPSAGVDQSLGGIRSRGFLETIKNDINTPQKVKDNLTSLYEVRNTKDLQTKAANLVKSNPDMAQRIASSDSGDISAMVGSELIKHHSALGNYEQAIATAHEVARQATEHGRASQALSAYAKLTPEGILRFTQSEINKFNTANKLATGKQITLTPEKAKSLTDKSTALQSMPEGRAKDIETQKMLREVKDILPVGWVKKVSTLQTIGQLLNPKTTVRNILGNAIFGTMDNVSQVGAAGLDKITSAVLKSERTTAFPNLKVQAQGAVKGGKQAYEETLQGINLGPDTQFDLSQVPVFKSNFMQGIEKTLGVTLRVPDRAAYTAAFDDTLDGLMKANKVSKPTQQMLDLANANGLYRTFQDNSKAAQLFTGLKGALNYVGVEKNGSRFGLGDFILKYPKTPGNIISRGLDYSPAGIVKGLYQIAKPAITKQPFDQHTFVNSISRGTLGTGGLIGAGAVLGALGIITEKPSQDKDTRNLQKASGQGGYQINTSALVRFIKSGFNKDSTAIQPGDNLVSYDWAQPLSIPLSAGAAIGKGQNAIDGATSTIENLTGGLNTLVEQPLISGLNTFANNIKNKGVIGAGGETLKAAPASFVPTVSNQVRQLTDNTSRSTYDPNAVNESINKVINRVPFLDKLLPAQIDSLGNVKENYADGSNNVFNVMLNPSFVTKYNPDAAAKLPLDILAQSGETQQMPRTTLTKQSVSGKNIELTPAQNHDFQQYVGQHTNDYYNQLLGNPTFMAKPDSEKAKIMSGGLTDISKAGKIAILGDTSKATSAQNAIARGSNAYKTTMGNSPNTTYADLYSTAQNEYNANQATYSPIGRMKKEKELSRLKAKSDFSNDTVDLYEFNKTDLYNYVSKDPDGKAIVDNLLKLDDALVKTGATSKLRDKNGNLSLKAPVSAASKKASAGRKASTKSFTAYNTLGSSTTSALRNLVKGTKITRKRVSAKKVTGKNK